MVDRSPARLGITATGKLLHIVSERPGQERGVALCGRDAMCTARGYGTIDEPRSPLCRRCRRVYDEDVA